MESNPDNIKSMEFFLLVLGSLSLSVFVTSMDSHSLTLSLSLSLQVKIRFSFFKSVMHQELSWKVSNWKEYCFSQISSPSSKNSTQLNEHRITFKVFFPPSNNLHMLSYYSLKGFSTLLYLSLSHHHHFPDLNTERQRETETNMRNRQNFSFACQKKSWLLL
jgi:hypothetical protein